MSIEKSNTKNNTKNIKKEDLLSTRRTSKKGVPIYKENPFWEPTTVKVGKKFITVAGGMLVNEDTGEEMTHAGVHKVEYVDKEQFVKLYTRNMKVFFDIKPSTQKVLMCILDAVQSNPNLDSIYLPWFEVADFSKDHDLKLSERSFYTAMKELLKKDFIAEAEVPNKYWINVHLFFNGDRMAFVNEYRIKQREERRSPNKALDSDQNQQDELFES